MSEAYETPLRSGKSDNFPNIVFFIETYLDEQHLDCKQSSWEVRV